MTKLKKIVSHLHSSYPTSKMEEWDQAGLQYGNPKQGIERVFVALDLTTEILEKAVDYRADLIITHHPFIWEGSIEEDVKKAPYKQVIHNRLLNTGIAVLSLHTNYDQSPKGTSFQIARRLTENINHSKSVKYAHIISERTTVKQIETRMTESFGVTTFISNEHKNKVFHKFAILPGSGSIEDMITLQEKEDIQLIVSSDIKWSDWLTIDELGLNVIEITHGIESVFVEDIANQISSSFKDVEAKFEYSEEIGKL